MATKQFTPRRNHFAGVRKQPETQTGYQHCWSTMEFDYVGRHHQLDLPPGLQKLSGRGAKAAGVGLMTVRR
jgi:hypothetical protein